MLAGCWRDAGGMLAVCVLLGGRGLAARAMLRASGVGFISRDGLLGSRSTLVLARNTAGIHSVIRAGARCGRVI